MDCRHCGTPLTLKFVDLGSAPPSNAYLTASDLSKPESWLPLRVLVCTNCWLVQTDDYTEAETLFTADYAYFSSYSKSWLEHAANFVTAAVERFRLTTSSLVVELAANDGYLLQYVLARRIPCIGVEPTAGTAAKAQERGIRIIQDFFGTRLARKMAGESMQADLLVANNVLAHVPDINDFASGVAIVLKDNGVATFEFPHLLSLVTHNQFDTIYHEHFSYLSLTSVTRIFDVNGLSVFDVDRLPTHGGSLRVYAQRKSGPHERADTVDALLTVENSAGLTTKDYYIGFQQRVNETKDEFLKFLIDAKQAGKKIAAYGAAAKGSTLINYAGVRSDLIPYVVDKSPEKTGRFLPGSRIQIVAADRIPRERPDYVVVLPWNILDEIAADLSYIRDWNGQFVIAIPKLRVI